MWYNRLSKQAKGSEGMGVLICPICKSKLEQEERRFACKNGHSFDLAAAGYLHLLPSNRMRAKIPGDNKQMVQARRDFLSKGYYQPVSDCLNEVVTACCQQIAGKKKPLQLLDAGCGEGYYTAGLHEALPQARVCGFDISKLAVKAAAGKYKSVEFGVASSFAIPLGKASVHLLTDVFSPLAAEEFARVVKPGGFFLYAVPGERHLYGLKELLYENPYENPHRETEYPGFRFVGRTAVRGEIRVPDSQTAVDLFTMTPYYWKTGPQAAQRLETVEGFSTEIGFDFLLYQRQ